MSTRIVIVAPVSPGSGRFGFWLADGRRDGTAEGPLGFMVGVAKASGHRVRVRA